MGSAPGVSPVNFHTVVVSLNLGSAPSVRILSSVCSVRRSYSVVGLFCSPFGFHLGLLVVVIGLGLFVALACGLGFLLVVVLRGCTWLRRLPICLLALVVAVFLAGGSLDLDFTSLRIVGRAP